jgi:Cu+-exporting ATPase
MRVNLLAVLAVLAVGLAVATPSRANPPVQTTINIPDLDCGGCAKKVAAKLAEVAGVGAVKPDVEGKKVLVTPKQGQAPSPRALWEAVEKAGKTPKRLEGPTGTYSAKPRS